MIILGDAETIEESKEPFRETKAGMRGVQEES